MQTPKNDSFGERAARVALVVLGMHRSGTSAMARSLALSGAALPAVLMPAADGNLAGHWEPERIADFNEAVLNAQGSRWDEIFGPRGGAQTAGEDKPLMSRARQLLRDDYGDADLIVLKEPRINRLLDLWRPALELEGFAPVYIFMVRSPQEVAASLRLRNGLSTSQGLLLWASYMLTAERATRGQPRVFIPFDQLLYEPEKALDAVEATSRIRLPRRNRDAALEIEDFLRLELKTSLPPGLGSRPGFEPVGRLHDYFMAEAQGQPLNDDIPADVALWLNGLETVMGPVIAANDRAQAQLKTEADRLSGAAEAAQAQIAAGAEMTRSLRAQLDQSQLLIARLTEEGGAARDGLAAATEQMAGLHEALRIGDEERESAQRQICRLAEDLQAQKAAAVCASEASAATAERIELAHTAEIDMVLSELERTRARVAEMQAVVADLKSSTSWRLSAPLRAAKGWLRRS
jgi:hypothetical protein